MFPIVIVTALAAVAMAQTTITSSVSSTLSVPPEAHTTVKAYLPDVIDRMHLTGSVQYAMPCGQTTMAVHGCSQRDGHYRAKEYCSALAEAGMSPAEGIMIIGPSSIELQFSSTSLGGLNKPGLEASATATCKISHGKKNHKVEKVECKGHVTHSANHKKAKTTKLPNFNKKNFDLHELTITAGASNLATATCNL